jgi:hypothetical protein
MKQIFMYGPTISTPEDTGVDGKTFQQYSMTSSSARQEGR